MDHIRRELEFVVASAVTRNEVSTAFNWQRIIQNFVAAVEQERPMDLVGLVTLAEESLRQLVSDRATRILFLMNGGEDQTDLSIPTT